MAAKKLTGLKDAISGVLAGKMDRAENNLRRSKLSQAELGREDAEIEADIQQIKYHVKVDRGIKDGQ